MVPGRFKDFISTPKRNGYRSLHTSVIHDSKMRIEIQIRDREMHEQAERGLAAHWAYKEGKPSADLHVPWIDDLVEILDHAESPEELLEHTRMAMYQDRIFAFTPKGELIQLPKGATPVDFAYAVHTDLGDRTVGAKVNGRVVPLRTMLENGDQVEILASEAQHPQPSGCASSPPARRAPECAASSATRSARRRSSSAARSTTRSSSGCPAELDKDAQKRALKKLKIEDAGRADDRDRAQADQRRGADGSADAGLSRRRCRAAPARPAHGHLDQGPDARASPITSRPAATRSPATASSACAARTRKSRSM